MAMAPEKHVEERPGAQASRGDIAEFEAETVSRLRSWVKDNQDRMESDVRRFRRLLIAMLCIGVLSTLGLLILSYTRIAARLGAAAEAERRATDLQARLDGLAETAAQIDRQFAAQSASQGKTLGRIEELTKQVQALRDDAQASAQRAENAAGSITGAQRSVQKDQQHSPQQRDSKSGANVGAPAGAAATNESAADKSATDKN
jgi:hypothetical protein